LEYGPTSPFYRVLFIGLSHHARRCRGLGGPDRYPPDLVPVISKVDAISGLTVATGFSGHGFALGPGAGRLASELATNQTPFVDIHPFRITRFSDGSGIKRPEMM